MNEQIPSNPNYGNDCYFSSSGGLAESLHVFVGGNKLFERMGACSGTPDVPLPLVGESGFGTGLNLHALLHTARNALLPLALPMPLDEAGFEAPTLRYRLRFMSVEKYPLSPLARESALAGQDLDPELSHPLQEVYVTLHAGLTPGWNRVCTPIHAAPGLVVELDLWLWFGDVLDFLSAWAKDFPDTKADAWFLEGHDPALNPDMWSPEVCAGLGANSACDRTTFATYTAAGLVKRNLRSAGFFVVRRPGFGPKRHMIQGHYQGPA